jgi:hypothetical protein
VLNSTQTLTLYQTLTEAFTPEEVQELLRTHLGLRLDRVVSPEAPLSVQAREVIQMAERAGWTDDLIRAVFLARPTRPELAELAKSAGVTIPVTVGEAGTRAALPAFTERPRPQSLSTIDPAEWVRRTALLQNAVCRVEVGGRSFGTGFLVGPDTILTSHAVLQSVFEKEYSPDSVWCRFDYRRKPSGEIDSGTVARLHGDRGILDAIEAPLGYCLLRLDAEVGREPLTPGGPPRGWLHIPDEAPVLIPGAPLFIAYYPGSGGLILSADPHAIVETTSDAKVRYRVSTEPGSAGAPCLDAELRVVAMHLSRVDADGKPGGLGEGILIAAIRDRLRKQNLQDALGGEAPAEAVPAVPDLSGDSKPPEPRPVKCVEDPQRGRWGRQAQRSGRRLFVELLDTEGRVFQFNAIVESTDGSPLEGPVVFHLHDTYPKSVIWVRKIHDGRRAVIWEITSYGVYTIGAQVKNAQGKWVGLEYNLVKEKELPQRFKER